MPTKKDHIRGRIMHQMLDLARHMGFNDVRQVPMDPSAIHEVVSAWSITRPEFDEALQSLIQDGYIRDAGQPGYAGHVSLTDAGLKALKTS